MKNHHSDKRQRIQCGIAMICILMTLFGIQAAESKDSAPVTGGEIKASLYATPHHLNPAIQSGLATAFPGAQIFAGLVRYDNQWNPHPYLAEKWDISPDGLTVTLHLRKNAVFHDGKPITSEDVAFSIMTVKAHHPFQSMMAPVGKVDTPTPHTVIVRLVKPHPALLLAMSAALLPILPMHVYGSVEKVRDHPANMNPVGSGPFRLKEFVRGKHILLEKNREFFIKDRPYLDHIHIKIINNLQEESMSFEVGDTQLMLSFHNLKKMRYLSMLDHTVTLTDAFKGTGPIGWLAFNLRKKPFDDLRVRKAFAYTIDREFIVRTLFEGQTNMETGPISSHSPFYSKDVNLYPQNFKLANKLLDEAGYARDANGRRFAFRLTYIPHKTGNFFQICDYLRHLFLLKLGVEANIENPETFTEWAGKVSDWDFDVTLDSAYNWGDPVIGVHRTYFTSNIRKGVIWSNTQGYSNPVADKLMEQAGSEPDFRKRHALYGQFQKIITDDLPVYSLYERKMLLIHHKDIAGFGQSIWGVMTPLDNLFWKGDTP
ncbi:ABC transporter substrate-binding protein [Desulfobacterales bacterium HSG2]|nr:ABC transporter substrate-binding protein [Desulfobacterales bacterium HSG2]